MYLVTGGAGFIGSNLVAALARRGDRVLVSDTLDDAKHKNLAKRGPWVLCLSPDQLPGAIESYGGTIEGVFHLGAISSTTEMDVAKLSRTNVELSQQLWQWCVEQQIPYIYASSAAVYGDGSQGFEDNPSPNALAKLQPLNPYGRSNLGGP